MNKKGITFTPSYRNAIIVVSGIFLLVSISFYSCRNLKSNTASLDVPSAEQTRTLMRIDSTHENFNHLGNKDLVYQFYCLKDFNVVWLENNQLTIDADSLLKFIEYTRYYGLLPGSYYKTELEQLKTFAPNEKEKQQRIELLLTDAFFSLAHDLNFGRLIRKQTESDPDSIRLSLLHDALSRHTIIASLKSQQPKNKDYEAMQLYLQKVIGETDSLTQQTFFNGIEDDTAALTREIRTIELNMHRWRRDRDIQGRYLLVNIPEYYLRVSDDDSLILESKIIVGTEKDRTPELNGKIKSFTLYPYWTVPRRIAVNELLPQIIKDSSYLSTHHFELFDASGKIVDPSGIDFSLYHKDNFPFTLRQKEGLANSLGVIKFTFQNPYAVYLHDTNARLLFNRKKRALSHGCVRVEKALELARYLLSDNDVVTAEDLDQYLEFKTQITIRVNNPLPIYIRYYTCSVQGGEIKFFDDVYGIDARDQESLLLNKKRDVAISL